MSFSESEVDVSQLRVLGLADHKWKRVDVALSADLKGADLVRGDYHGPLPLRAVVGEEGAVGDLIGTFWASVFLISNRLSKAFKDLRLSGWRSLPVSVKGDSNLLEDVAVLAVTGRAGPIYGAGGATRPDLDMIGQYLDPHEWDGSDLFLPRNRRSILVTGPAAKEIARFRFRNVDLRPAGIEPLPK